MFQLIASVLAWYYGIVHNYAAAIALLTVSIMVLLTPLTLKGTKSMLELQRLQPEIKKLQAEHKGDRQKLNEEMMRLYQEHKINPLGGCLPLLLQMPVFLVLYRVLHKLTQACPGASPGATFSEQIKGVPGRCVDTANQFIVAKGNFGASYVKQSSQLWQDLSHGNTMPMHFLNVNLARPATQAISESFLTGLPYLVLVLLVALTSYYQQRQISARTKNQQVNPQQQMIMRLMPAFFAVITLTLPAYLSIYFLSSNLYRIAQQAYITRRFYREDHEAAAESDTKRAAKADSGKGRPAPNRPAPSKAPKPGRVTPPKNAAPTKSAAPTQQTATPPKGASTPKSATKGSPTRPATPPPNRPTPRSHPRPTPKKKD